MNGHSDVVGAEEDGTITFNEETRCYEEVKDYHPLHSNITQEMLSSQTLDHHMTNTDERYVVTLR